MTTKKEDKITIIGRKGEGEPTTKEVSLGINEFKFEPEWVEAGLGLTISPKEFESIRIDYKCKIYHVPGQDARSLAFDVATKSCVDRLREDVTDLHNGGVIQDHFLVEHKEETTEQS